MAPCLPRGKRSTYSPLNSSKASFPSMVSPVGLRLTLAKNPSWLTRKGDLRPLRCCFGVFEISCKVRHKREYIGCCGAQGIFSGRHLDMSGSSHHPILAIECGWTGRVYQHLPVARLGTPCENAHNMSPPLRQPQQGPPPVEIRHRTRVVVYNSKKSSARHESTVPGPRWSAVYLGMFAHA